MAVHARRTVSLGGSLKVAALPPGAEDATRERLRHALRGGDALAEGGTRRIADPFDALRNRQSLDRHSRSRNALLWAAGDRYRRHWHAGQLDGLATLDIGRVSVDGGGAPTGGPTEAARLHRDRHHRAGEAVGPRLLPYLVGMVIDGQPAAALCHLVTDTAHPRTAEALVIERLREALHRLVEHWGMEGGRPGRRSAAQHLAGIEQA